MQICNDLTLLDAKIEADNRWNNEMTNPLMMHSIHVYPAKFPPFIAKEAFEYAQEENVHCDQVADIFCGCGTVALEAKTRGLPFWGCDINPVAVLIARTKTDNYDIYQLQKYYQEIEKRYEELINVEFCEQYNESTYERLKYWFSEEAFKKLFCLKKSIESVAGNSRYKNVFLCIFSSILKSASKWLQKSIKPQIDLNKIPADAKKLFDAQMRKFFKAVQEINDLNIVKTSIEIEEEDFLKISKEQEIDLIITSPPYVTSYEYADLHQLSSLWLGYANDYRDLRNGSIGSTYNSQSIELDLLNLNSTGTSIVGALKNAEVQSSRIKAIARYYSDIEKVVEKCAKMLRKNGMAVFVIGDSELKGIKLHNSKHLIESMMTQKFCDIKIGKRTIEKTMCVPFRNSKGRFTQKEKSNNEIYHEEFVISGRIR